SSDGGALPWASGDAVQSPLEVLASRVASSIAGRPVQVDCEGAWTWQQSGSGEADGTVVFYSNGPGTPAHPGDVTKLSPTACDLLNRFALADPKPTKCQTTT